MQESPDPQVADSASTIARKTARGGLSMATRTGAVQLIQLASTLFIAHLILPSAYGAIAVALAALGFARYVGDLGVSSSFLPLPTLSDDDFRSGALVAVGLAIIETIALVLAAPLIAAVLHGPPYTAALIRLLALCLIFEALRFGPIVRLNRELRFGRYGTLSLIETLVLYAFQIGLLVAGAGVWALVIGQLARSSLGTLAYWFGAGGMLRPAWRVSLRRLVARALPYQGPAIAFGAISLLLPLAIGIVLNSRGVGYWAWATVLAAPITALVTVMSGVTLPSLARLRAVQESAVERAADLMLRVSIVAPAVGAGVLLGLARPTLVYVFGRRWLPALPAVELNLIGIVPWTLSFFLAAVLESEQRARERLAAVLLAQGIGLVAAVGLALRFGVAGATFSSAILTPVVDVVVLGALTGVRYMRALASGVAGLGASALFAWGASQLVSNVWTLVAAGALCIVPAMLIIWMSDREAARAVLRLGEPLPMALRRRLGIDAVRVASEID
jgi:PST family polysaccharide transporter